MNSITVNSPPEVILTPDIRHTITLEGGDVITTDLGHSLTVEGTAEVVHITDNTYTISVDGQPITVLTGDGNIVNKKLRFKHEDDAMWELDIAYDLFLIDSTEGIRTIVLPPAEIVRGRLFYLHRYAGTHCWNFNYWPDDTWFHTEGGRFSVNRTMLLFSTGGGWQNLSPWIPLDEFEDDYLCDES